MINLNFSENENQASKIPFFGLIITASLGLMFNMETGIIGRCFLRRHKIKKREQVSPFNFHA